jgi:hypothetical protein
VIWVTWRQQRTETLIGLLLLALVVALLVPTGLHMASVYDRDGIAACLGDPSADCGGRLDSFVSRWDSLVNVVGWLNLLPALLGALIATPLVLEVERGTFRLAWTQSVTRDRWLAVRLGAIVAASLVVAALLTLLMTWWRDPLDQVNGRFDGFDLEGIVPAAYTLFAAALVLAAGVLLRRSAPAIGLALVAFITARIAIATWLRPHYQSPLHESWQTGSGPDLRDAWVFNQLHEVHTSAGLPVDPRTMFECVTDGSKKLLDDACLDRHGFVESMSATYQPGSRFWTFQAIEAGMYAAAALALIAFAAWWIRKRVS